MTGAAFKVWRVLEEKEVADERGHKYRTITKKEFIGEIVNPGQEIYVTWMELAERFGEGYYLVEIPREIRQQYVVPAEQRVKTPGALLIGSSWRIRSVTANDWSAAKRMIAASRPYFHAKCNELRSLAEESNRRLSPLDEPLLVDFGAHRWLSREREEAYSDWLEWIVKQLKKPEVVLPLFGVNDPDDPSACRNDGQPLECAREFSIREEERNRRLDILISYRSVAVLIEVKLVRAEDAELEKNKDYLQYFEKHYRVHHRHAVLLAVDGEKTVYDGFSLLRWADVCVYLRRTVPKLLKENRSLAAAMVLSFAGAVEQNLLGFPSLTMGADTFVGNWDEATKHLRRWMDGEFTC